MPEVTVRSADQNDYLSVYEFVSTCPPLEHYYEHFYKIILRYFGDTCFIAEENGRIVGFLLGFFSQKHKKTCFLWQIGVALSHRGKGISSLLLEAVEKKCLDRGIQRIELTVDPENIKSKKFFEKMGFHNASENEGNILEIGGTIAVKDYYKPGRHFILYEKKL